MTFQVDGTRQREHLWKTWWNCVKNDMESFGIVREMHSIGISGGKIKEATG